MSASMFWLGTLQIALGVGLAWVCVVTIFETSNGVTEILQKVKLKLWKRRMRRNAPAQK